MGTTGTDNFIRFFPNRGSLTKLGLLPPGKFPLADPDHPFRLRVGSLVDSVACHHPPRRRASPTLAGCHFVVGTRKSTARRIPFSDPHPLDVCMPVFAEFTIDRKRSRGDKCKASLIELNPPFRHIIWKVRPVGLDSVWSRIGSCMVHKGTSNAAITRVSLKSSPVDVLQHRFHVL